MYGDLDCEFESQDGHVVVFLRKALYGNFPAWLLAFGRNTLCQL